MFYLMVAFSRIYFPFDSRRCLLLAQARPIVFYWFYKVFLSTVFSLVVVPSQKRSRTVHPRGEAGFPLVLQWLPCWAARSWRREAAVGQFHRMQGYVRNAWFPKVLQGFRANRVGPFFLARPFGLETFVLPTFLKGFVGPFFWPLQLYKASQS